MYLRSGTFLDLKLAILNYEACLFVCLHSHADRHTEKNLKREGGPNIQSRKHDLTGTQGTQYHFRDVARGGDPGVPVTPPL